MAKKKADDMREQLRQVITFTRGHLWQELIRMEGEIRKKRQQAIYDQKEYRRKVIDTLACNHTCCDNIWSNHLGYLFYSWMSKV